MAFIFFSSAKCLAQTEHHKIEWSLENSQFPGDFKNAQFGVYSSEKVYPFWVQSILKGNSLFEVTLINASYEKIEANEVFKDFLKAVKQFEYFNTEERGQNRLKVKIVPFRLNNNEVERLVSFDLAYKNNGSGFQKLNKKGNKNTSVLSTGEWYKIRIAQDAIYKLDKAFFTKSGINVNDINLNTFKIYGNGGGMLPEVIAIPRPDDLIENAIKIFDGNSNNKLDDGDFISFFGKGPNSWTDRDTDYLHVRNVYSSYAYYFFTWGSGQGKRLTETGENSTLSPLRSFNTSDYLYVHEIDNLNFRSSGREWFGEALTIENHSFNISLPDITDTDKMSITSEVAVRTAIPVPVYVRLNSDALIITHPGYPVNFDTDGNYVSVNKQTVALSPIPNFTLTYEFYRPQLGSEAWLNYFEVQCKRKLKPVNGQILFFNLDTRINGYVKYQIENFSSDYTIWDVTNPTEASNQKTFQEGSFSSFIFNPKNTLNRYLLFKNGSEVLPEFVGKLANQNLHALEPVDYIIITHQNFIPQAEKLAKFHEQREGYSYLITTPDKIYNEFSSGALDISAIRDFVKMIYDREPDVAKKPKGLLLLGDASYDFKNIKGNTNWLPTLESYEYNNSVSSYCSDDYFVILGDIEGYWPRDNGTFQESMDMAIGRLPAGSTYEAEVMVDKCIHYKTNSDKGEWRSSITLLGDDEDDNEHISKTDGSELLADVVEAKYSNTNITKIYLDSYKQVSLGNGNAYPEVNEAINNSLAKGTLVFNYLGHGGTSGMAHERVVTRPQILGWKNYDKLTFFITGTCDLAQYDNPAEQSPGELMMLNNEGGAIGMMTTSRKVYIGLNMRFALNLLRDYLFEKDGTHFKTIGQAYSDVKNVMWNETNTRNYVMFGDPLLDLNIPMLKTKITAINGNQITASSLDTLKALSKVEITGMVTDLSDNILLDFDGDVAVTLFDKKQNYKTLVNDPGSKTMPFTMRNSVLYRGKASVKSGVFKVTFILPKDIDYSIGHGRIYSYAYNSKTDAVGVYDSAFVGGTGNALVKDESGPRIDVFLEDEKFVNGGIVNKDPLLIVKLWDENGINTAGNGVGREILATLNKGKPGTKNYILNEFYSTTLDSFQGGEIRFKMADLTPGNHTLLVRAWDVYNNSNEIQVEFLVANDENMSVKNLLNYPNPFTTKTNILFDHNKSGQELSVSVNIYSISGKIVKSLYTKIPNAASHVDQIEWDGKDEYGQKLARGVYLYKVKVKAEDGKTEELLQKMVLLK